MDIVNKIIDLTNTTIDNWANKYWGYAPDNVSSELDKIYFERIKSFTVELNPMYEKAIAEIDTDLTEGQRVVSYLILGALVEGWMFIFIKFYLNDYNKNPLLDRDGKKIFVDDLNFYSIIEYFEKNIWKSFSDPNLNNSTTVSKWLEILNWVKKIRKYRNSIHLQEQKEIGTTVEWLSDLEKYYQFLDVITFGLPEPAE